ncbi:MAG: exonuclease SbcCD subunit D C-terminal domain-containing protein [Marinilabiliaceae bacterium]|nr:exonuclease SbcCD subunit D C-terminal domain-containing protein [Marinilabiliaceae bacterium]
MKILHTSDWHIGQRLHGNDRDEEHRLFFDWLIRQINTEQVDALLIAGDVFDVGFPSNSALKLYYTFLTSLIGTSCRQVVIIGGNHDYISTLEAPAKVLEALNIKVIGGARENLEEELITLKSTDDVPEVVIAAVPFLRDKDIRLVNMGESYEDRVEAVNQGIVNHYQQVADLAAKNHLPIIAMGHLYVQGAALSESEREIHIGNLAGLDVRSFPNLFDYVALGHIHRPQKLDLDGRVRYCGSPLPLSFSECQDQKQIIVLDVNDSGISAINPIAIPGFRRLISFKGNFPDVEMKMKGYVTSSQLNDWAEVTIEEPEMNPALRTQFEELVERMNTMDNGWRIIKPSLRFENQNNLGFEQEETASLADMAVTDVFDRLLETRQVNNREELAQTFAELMDHVQHQTEND